MIDIHAAVDAADHSAISWGGNTRQRTRKFAILLSCTVTTCYLAYRGVFTLNLESHYSTAASLSLFLAELHGTGLLWLFFFQVWEPVHPESPPVLMDRTVDVFIPTLNEETHLVRGTVEAAKQMDYPHRTWILDDGDRKEISDLADDLDVGYLSRSTNDGFKAGNLNNAMHQTNGEFIAVFDADHVPRKDFIQKTIGFFADENVGFVQTPHAVYNFHNCYGVTNDDCSRYWDADQVFHRVVQSGKNRWNAVVFCGSAALLRRKTLEDVGLFATQTITEDIHTGLKIHRKGWQGIFYNETLSCGLMPTSRSAFWIQRLRWAVGNLDLLRIEHFFRRKGLTTAQVISYYSSTVGWTGGVATLQIYLASLLVLLTGISPVAYLNATFGVLITLNVVMIWTTMVLVSRGYCRLIAAEVARVQLFAIELVAVAKTLSRPVQRVFRVTDKGVSRSAYTVTMGETSLLVAALVALHWSMASSNASTELTSGPQAVAFLLTVIYATLAWKALRTNSSEINGIEHDS